VKRETGVACERTERGAPPSHATLGPAAPRLEGGGRSQRRGALAGGAAGTWGCPTRSRLDDGGGAGHLDLDGGRGAVRGRSSDLRPEGRPRAADPCACARGAAPGPPPPLGGPSAPPLVCEEDTRAGTRGGLPAAAAAAASSAAAAGLLGGRRLASTTLGPALMYIRSVRLLLGCGGRRRRGGEQRMLLQCPHDRCPGPISWPSPEGCGHPAGQGRGRRGSPPHRQSQPHPLPCVLTIVPRPRVDARVPEQGLQDGQVALPSRPVKRGPSFLQGTRKVEGVRVGGVVFSKAGFQIARAGDTGQRLGRSGSVAPAGDSAWDHTRTPLSMPAVPYVPPHTGTHSPVLSLHPHLVPSPGPRVGPGAKPAGLAGGPS